MIIQEAIDIVALAINVTDNWSTLWYLGGPGFLGFVYFWQEDIWLLGCSWGQRLEWLNCFCVIYFSSFIFDKIALIFGITLG